MVEDTRVRGPNVGLEAAVQDANLAPVQVKSLDISVLDASAELGLLESGANGTHRGLRGQTGHAYYR